MNSPRHSWKEPNLYPLQQKKLYRRLAIAVLIPASLLTNTIAAYAIPQAATITDLQPTTGRGVPSIRLDLTQTPAPAVIDQEIDLRFEHAIPQQSMIVSGSRSQVRQRNRANVTLDNPSDTIVQIGPSQTTTEYLFPCAIRGGNGTVGWKATARSSRGCTSLIARSGGSSFATENPDLTEQPVQIANKSLQAQNSAASFQYCGALEANGSGWGFNYSTDGTNPCQQAIEECESAGEVCSVTTMGQESFAAPKLIASAQCPGILTLKTEGNGQAMVSSELEILKKMARSLRGESCLINVYQPGDVVISPASDGLTLVKIQTSSSGNVEVLALVGTVDIVSADRPRGLVLPEGSMYRSGKSDVEALDCPTILNSESMQSFLNPAYWTGSSDISSQLAGYQTEFCQNKLEPTPDRPRIIIPISPFPRPDGGSDTPGRGSDGSNPPPLPSTPPPEPSGGSNTDDDGGATDPPPSSPPSPDQDSSPIR
jgi:hypothetical protein